MTYIQAWYRRIFQTLGFVFPFVAEKCDLILFSAPSEGEPPLLVLASSRFSASSRSRPIMIPNEDS